MPWQTLMSGGLALLPKHLGLQKLHLKQATEYAKDRVQFGKPIAANKGLDLNLRIWRRSVEAAKLLVYRAAYLRVQRIAVRKRSINGEIICFKNSSRSDN